LHAYQHGNVRGEAIEAALRLISQSGLTRLSLRDVAGEIGVSHAALYRYFADKEALLASIAQEGFEGLISAINEAGKKNGDLKKRLFESGRAYVEFAVRNPDRFRLMFSDAIRNRSDYPDLDSASRRSFQQLVGIIDECFESGLTLRHKNRHVNVLAAWSMLHGLSFLLIEKQFTDEKRKDHIRFLTERFLELLLP